MRATSPGDLQGRKKVRLRMRQNLHITPQNRGGRICFVVKDPVTLRYFHFDETQRFILGMMDGIHSLEEIRQTYETRHRPHRMSLEELETFARQLLESNLVYSESPLAAQQTITQATKQNRKRWLSWLNLFCIRMPLSNPDRWLTRAHFVGRLVFNYWFLVASMGLFLGAIGLLATHWQEFLARLPNYSDFFSLQTVFLLWLTLGLVKVLHELGHAFCCKRMGAQVQELGVLVLFFFPTLYCNVSDSWTLPSKWKRMAVSAAGIYVELIIASLATFLWWFSDANTFLNNLCFAAMAVCSVNTIVCNANPLMRFDGYYVLADWLEIPNLAQQANQTIQTTVLRWLGVEVRSEDAEHATFLFWFGLASAVYRWYVIALTFYFLYVFLKQHHLAMLGVLLATIGLATLIGRPVFQVASWLRQLGRFPEMKTIRVWLALGIVSALIAGFFLMPLPRKVRGAALVQVTPEHVRRMVVPETGGFLQTLGVRDGQHVKAGEILAVLANPTLAIKLRLNEADQALRNQQQNAFVAQLSDIGNPKNDFSSDWQQCGHELKVLMQQHRTLQEQQDRLVLRAPVAGIVMGLPSPEEKGKWLEKGTELCRIGNGEALRVLVLVDPADHNDVRPSSQAWIRLHGSQGKQYPGFVTGIAQVEAKNIPAALSTRVAGDVPTQHDAASNTDKPHGQFYLVSVQFGAVDAAIHPGILGRVKIDAEPRTLAWRLRRYLGTTVNWGL